MFDLITRRSGALLVGPELLRDQTIINAERRMKPPDFNDSGCIELTFVDSTKAVIISECDGLLGCLEGLDLPHIAVIGCSFLDYLIYQKMAEAIQSIETYLICLDLQLNDQTSWTQIAWILRDQQESDGPSLVEQVCQTMDLVCRSISAHEFNALINYAKQELAIEPDW